MFCVYINYEDSKYKTDCNHVIFRSHTSNFMYCPFCGKKIRFIKKKL